MDKEWHQDHRLDADASRQERVAWHAVHEEVCHCRPAPKDLAEEIRLYKNAAH
jgi:hypothetical protein